MTRFLVDGGGLVLRPRYDRRFAVLDMKRKAPDGKPLIVLQTDDPNRARDYAHECNQQEIEARNWNRSNGR